MTDQKVSNIALKIKKEINAPVSKVYQAWVNPQHMSQWMGPGSVTCKKVDIDLTVGGKYRIHMIEDGGDHIAFGEYLEIEENKKLKFSWGWEQNDVRNTIVTLLFASKGDKTELTLIHENFTNEDIKGKHEMGWGGCLAKLEKHLGL